MQSIKESYGLTTDGVSESEGNVVTTVIEHSDGTVYRIAIETKQDGSIAGRVERIDG